MKTPPMPEAFRRVCERAADYGRAELVSFARGLEEQGRLLDADTLEIFARELSPDKKEFERHLGDLEKIRRRPKDES